MRKGLAFAVVLVLGGSSCTDVGSAREDIVGGLPDTDSRFTNVVIVGNGCSGALVTRRHVLTAAHCVCDAEASLPQNVLDDRDCVGQVSVTFKPLPQGTHPQQGRVNALPTFHVDIGPPTTCGPKSFLNPRDDLAVITLDSDAPPSIAAMPYGRYEPADGQQVFAVGFGAFQCSNNCTAGAFGTRRIGANSISDVLDQHVKIRASGGTLPGPGDSGGPLIDRRPLQSVIGIANTITGCDPMAEANYIRIDRHALWIDGIIQSSLPPSPTCSDGIRNGSETGVDCGGTCPPCSTPTCPSGNGLYCGSTALGQDPSWLYRCTNGSFSLESNCEGRGCVVQPPGQNDECRQPPQQTCGNNVCETPAESCSTCSHDCCLPPPPLLNPVDGASIANNAQVQFRWSPVTDAAMYLVSVCANANLTDCFTYTSNGPETSWSPLAPPPGTYFWSVQSRPVNAAAGWGPPATPLRFGVTQVPGCVSTCVPNSHQCINGFEDSCADLDGDGCYTWSSHIQCPWGCRNAEVCWENPPPACGNGIVEGAEVCDGENMGGHTCQTEQFGGGTISCNQCQLDLTQCCQHEAGCDFVGATRCVAGAQQTCQLSGGCRRWSAPEQCANNACSGNVCAAAMCGNGVREAGEVCDGNSLGGETCASQGFDQGALGCTGMCSYDVSQCCRHDIGCDFVGAKRCNSGAQQTCQISGVGGCRHWSAPTQCANNACAGNTCALSICGNGVREAGEECDGNAIGGATCVGEGFDAGLLRCTPQCHYDPTSCCLDECQQWATSCEDASTELVCNDYNNDGCVEWGGYYTCPCTGGACSGDCFPFTMTLPAGTNARKIWFWPAAGDFIAEVNVTATGGVFPSPAGACSATLEYPGRWDSWVAVPRTFPAGAPQGTAALTFPGLGSVGFCELPVGQAAWGVAHDGGCHP